MRTLRGASCLHPSRCLSVRTLQGDFLCAPFEVPFLVYGKNVSSHSCERLVVVLRLEPLVSSGCCVFHCFLEKMSFVACWPCASGSKLLPSKVMCVRAVFFGEKYLPPFQADHCFGWFRGRIILFFWWTLERRVVHCRGSVRKVLCFGEKTSPFFLAHYCHEGSCVWLCMSRTMDAESKEKNVSPPFLACIFRFFRGCF